MTHSLNKMFAVIAICSCLAVSAFATTEADGMHLCQPANVNDEIYGIVFAANQSAQIRLIGDGSTILSLNVYDQNGNLVLSDVPSTNGHVVEWRPLQDGLFIVKVGPTEHSVLLTNGMCEQVETLVAQLVVTRTNGEGL